METRLLMQRETMTLASELTQLRAASTSLTNGTVKLLQVLGFLRDEPAVCSVSQRAEGETRADSRAEGRPTKVLEVEDLLEWEKLGKSLAVRIAREWHSKEVAGIYTLLGILDRKADAEDVAGLKALIVEAMPGAFARTAPVPQRQRALSPTRIDGASSRPISPVRTQQRTDPTPPLSPRRLEINPTMPQTPSTPASNLHTPSSLNFSKVRQQRFMGVDMLQ